MVFLQKIMTPEIFSQAGWGLVILVTSTTTITIEVVQVVVQVVSLVI
jgi:hypothetical protein